MDKGQVFICGGGWMDGTSCHVRCGGKDGEDRGHLLGFSARAWVAGGTSRREQGTLRDEEAGGDLGLPGGQGLWKTGAQASVRPSGGGGEHQARRGG